MPAPTTLQIIGASLFAIALVHTFSTKFFEHLARIRPAHAGMWHLLGEVEVVFGFWAMVLVMFVFMIDGPTTAIYYLDTRNFTEPMFVFAIMVVAGSRPVLHAATASVRALARIVPLPRGMATHFVALAFVPLLGSFITEPAAMTLAALILKQQFFSQGISNRLKYATLGTLFVNISIGGTLTPFAAPPVLMVAGKWDWDIAFMITHIGWRAALAVAIGALATSMVFRRELSAMQMKKIGGENPSPWPVVAIHLAFLAGVVAFAHHPPVFMGLLLFFLGFTVAYQRYQDRLILREGLMVAFFLAGLVVLGGEQQWWLEHLLKGMNADTVYFGASALTAVTDNAALTYLGSLVPDLSDDFKYALVTGAVTGGGLTVIANAPNPAGFAILREHFDEGSIHPVGLFAAATPATVLAILAFRLF